MTPAIARTPSIAATFAKRIFTARIAAVTDAPIASGANLDDLADYRPGLTAAAEHGVVHPYVLAGMTKAAVRSLARSYGLDDLSELPAQPCLSSRVETGLAIRAEDLAFIDRMEQLLAPHLPPGTDIRCRVTHGGIVVEASRELADDRLARDLCAAEGRAFLGVKPYRRGSAFLHAAQ